ncbi:MAG: hypothetical protein U0263_38980 [Polyangiaceae bacterium]
MARVFLFSVQLALGILVPWWIVRRDMRKIPETELDRAWTDPSFWSAIVLFGPLCLPFHYVKTRRSLLGLGLGVVWTFAALAVISAISMGLGALLGVD